MYFGIFLKRGRQDDAPLANFLHTRPIEQYLGRFNTRNVLPSMSFCSFIGEHKRNLDGHCLKLGTFGEDWPTQIQIAKTLGGTLLLKRMKKIMLLMLNYVFIYICIFLTKRKSFISSFLHTGNSLHSSPKNMTPLCVLCFLKRKTTQLLNVKSLNVHIG